jgi:hypothetical protein
LVAGGNFCSLSPVSRRECPSSTCRRPLQGARKEMPTQASRTFTSCPSREGQGLRFRASRRREACGSNPSHSRILESCLALPNSCALRTPSAGSQVQGRDVEQWQCYLREAVSCRVDGVGSEGDNSRERRGISWRLLESLAPGHTRLTDNHLALTRSCWRRPTPRQVVRRGD